MKATVILSHGLESGPDATKVTALAAVAERHGCLALRPDYRDQAHWPGRLQRLINIVDAANGPLVLVGSSLGAYISALASGQRACRGLYLLAPPIYESARLPPISWHCANTWIVHGWRDELIDPAQVFGAARECGARALFVDADHRLSGKVPMLEQDFDRFLAELSL